MKRRAFQTEPDMLESVGANARLPRRSRRRRWFMWLVLGLLVVLAGMGYRAFWLARPIGSGPAGPAVPRALFEHVWTDRTVLVVGIGDSITAGLGAAVPSHSLFNRLITNPPDEFAEMKGLCLSAVLPNIEAHNIAVSGSTSLDHLEVIRTRLPPRDPDTFGIVVMTTGGNDLIHWYGQRPPRENAMYGATRQQARPWIRSFQRRLDTMLDLIDAWFPGGCQIYLADIYDPTDGVGDAASVYLPSWPDGLAIHATYNRVIHQAAARRPNVHLVPLRATFLGHGTHCRQFWRSTYCRADPTYWFYSNIEDPNDRGHDAGRRAFLLEIAKTLPDIVDRKQPTR